MPGTADSIRVLHVDDQPSFADMAATFLEREDERISVLTATSTDEGLATLADREVDCIVSDYDMPGLNGIEFLETLREDHPDLPFILYTGKGSEEVASDAISAGVTDYLQKESGTDQYAVLANRITNAVEHHRSRRMVERSRGRLREIVDALPHFLYVVDEEGNYLLANEALAEFHDSTVEEIEGRNVSEVLDAPAAESFREDVDRVLEAGTAQRLPEVEIADPEGETHVFDPRLRPHDFGDSDTRAVLGIAVDVTDQRKQERRLETTISNLPGIVYRCRNAPGWPMEFIRGECESVTGHPAEAIENGDVGWGEDLIHPDDRDRVWEVVQDALDDDRAFEVTYRIRTAGGDTRWVWERGRLVDPGPEGEGVLEGFITDVTDREERERELERTNALLSTLFETLPVGVLAEDESREVLAINEQVFDLFGLSGSPEEAVGGDCERMAEEVSGMFADPERFVERISELCAAREPVDEEDIVLADGRTFERTYRPIELPDGAGHLWVYRDITDRKDRERDLQVMRRRLDAILENTTTPMFMKEESGEYVFVNRRYRELFDLRDETVVGRTDHELHPPEVADEVRENDLAVIEREEPVEIEERVVVDGEPRIFLSTKVPVYDTGERSDPEEPVAVFGVATDITERTEYEERLREEQQFVQSIFRSLPDPLYALDTEGYPIRWNERFEEVTGYSADEIEGMHVTDFVPEDEADTVATCYRTILDEHRSVTVESALETKDGERIPHEFTGSPLEDADGTVRGVTGVGHDVAERTSHERRLEALNRATRELLTAETREEVAEMAVDVAQETLDLEANSIHLYEEDSGLVPVAATDAIYDLVGDPPTFTGGDSIAWRVYERGEPLALDDVRDHPDVYNADTPVHGELYFPIGEEGLLIATSSTDETFDEYDVILGEILAGNIAAALAQVERTEQLRSRERELSRQNDRLNQFASIVSHDLRNPLNVAEGRLELAREDCDSEHLAPMGRAHERMRTLIEDLLALAREGEAVTDRERVDLAATVEDCWTTVDTTGATVVTDVERSVLADEGRVKQLFENLFRNSVEHGGDGVTVTVGELDDGFYVEDDGRGIPEGDREDVFEAGYSTSPEGTGFGLSIVERVAEAHDWRVRATEGTDGGARFEFTGVEWTAE